MNENKFVAYEYLSVPVKQSMETLYNDCFKSFGWVLENSVLQISNLNSVVLKFKRDRKLKNMPELTELQRKCENALISIEHLEQSKTSTAMLYALIIGIVGISLLTGALFSFLAKLIPLFILLGAFGFTGCALSYFVFNKTVEKKTLEVNKLIDQQYESIYEVCEKANKILI